MHDTLIDVHRRLSRIDGPHPAVVRCLEILETRIEDSTYWTPVGIDEVEAGDVVWLSDRAWTVTEMVLIEIGSKPEWSIELSAGGETRAMLIPDGHAVRRRPV